MLDCCILPLDVRLFPSARLRTPLSLFSVWCVRFPLSLLSAAYCACVLSVLFGGGKGFPVSFVLCGVWCG